MPDAARRRRRILLARVAFYAAAACIALVLIAARSSSGDAETPWVGTTDDGTPVSIEPGRDGRPARIDLQVTANCPSTGETWAARWFADEARIPFQRDGGRLRARESFENAFPDGVVAHNTFAIDARISGDRIEGVIAFTEFGDRGKGSDFVCTGGPVSFTAQR